MYRSLLAGLNGWHALVPMIALVILGWIAALNPGCLRLLCGVAAVAPLCALLACLPNWLVFANELVMFDTFVWELLLISILMAVFAAACARFAIGAAQRVGGSLATSQASRGIVPGQFGASE